MGIEIWISYNVHLSQNILLLLIAFSHLKVVHGPYKNRQAVGQIGSVGLSLPTPILESNFLQLFILSLSLSLSRSLSLPHPLPLLDSELINNRYMFTSPSPTPGRGKSFSRTSALNPSALGYCYQLQVVLRFCHCHHGLGFTGGTNANR